jgi:hypothetical protein
MVGAVLIENDHVCTLWRLNRVSIAKAITLGGKNESNLF